MDHINLNEIQIDALQELANIGASHAATALSQMVNKDIKIGIPRVEIIPVENTLDCVIHEDVIVGVYLEVPKELHTYSLLLLSLDSALELADVLTGGTHDEFKGDLDEMDKSAMQEVGNILMSSFFDSITEMVGTSMVPGPPTLAYDMPTAVLDLLLIEMGEIASEIIVLNVELIDEKEDKFHMDLFLMPEIKTVDSILQKIGMK